MIKQAKTPEEKRKCWDWIRGKGFTPMTDLFFYIDDIACAGITVGFGDTSKVGFIEPLLSDSVSASVALYNFCEGYLKGLGVQYIICVSTNEKVWNMLEKLNYRLWTDMSKQYIKEL